MASKICSWPIGWSEYRLRLVSTSMDSGMVWPVAVSAKLIDNLQTYLKLLPLIDCMTFVVVEHCIVIIVFTRCVISHWVDVDVCADLVKFQLFQFFSSPHCLSVWSLSSWLSLKGTEIRRKGNNWSSFRESHSSESSLEQSEAETHDVGHRVDVVIISLGVQFLLCLLLPHALL